MLAAALMIALVAVAAVTDLRQRRIYNATTYPGVVAALLGNVVGEALVGLGWVDADACRRLGWIGAWPSLAGLLLCGGVMIVCFVFFRIGGGDVKLIGMIGAFLGPERGLEAMLWTFVLGASSALAILVWRLGPVGIVRHAIAQLVWAARLGRHAPVAQEVQTQLRMPLFLAPSALAATLIVEFSLF